MSNFTESELAFEMSIYINLSIKAKSISENGFSLFLFYHTNCSAHGYFSFTSFSVTRGAAVNYRHTNDIV